MMTNYAQPLPRNPDVSVNSTRAIDMLNAFDHGAVEQLIQPDPPQLTFHQSCRLRRRLCGIVGGQVNSGVRLLVEW